MKFKKGLAGESSIKVQKENTAMELGSGLVPVFSTPMLVAVMENAAINALEDHIPDENTTVGGQINCTHLAPTPVGMTVTARAELVEISGNKLVFKIEAYDELEKIGEATHSRFVVNLQSFLNNAEIKKDKFDN